MVYSVNNLLDTHVGQHCPGALIGTLAPPQLGCSHCFVLHVTLPSLQSQVVHSSTCHSSPVCWSNEIIISYNHKYTVKRVIFAGFYFRHIHDFLMGREFNTTQITDKLYYIYCQHYLTVHINCPTANLSK